MEILGYHWSLYKTHYSSFNQCKWDKKLLIGYKRYTALLLNYIPSSQYLICILLNVPNRVPNIAVLFSIA